jgi:hypothetical protein
MNLCYCDESGTGTEPIAVMVGVVVDATRMHLTKSHWWQLLEDLSRLSGRQIVELHTRDFYSGSGVWHGIDGHERSRIMSAILAWLADRKHHVVYTGLIKDRYHQARVRQDIPDELNTLWRFMGFHLILAMQKHGQGDAGVKGHSIFVFDNEERERMRFTDLIARPPGWSDEYYSRRKKQEQLDHIVDVPYFGDSREVALIQLSDFLAFLLRRYAEIKEGVVPPTYHDEEEKMTQWVTSLAARSIGRRFMFPRTGRGYAENMFFDRAPAAVRDL